MYANGKKLFSSLLILDMSFFLKQNGGWREAPMMRHFYTQGLIAIILVAVVVVVGEVGCVIWFFAILISAICGGAAKLLMLIPCAIIFSVLSVIICFVEMKMDM